MSDFYLGDGSKDYPFIIKDIPDGNTAVYQLTEVMRQIEYVSGNYYYKLEQDIDLEGIYIKKIGTASVPFVGNFNGNGYTISNLKLWDNEGNEYSVLFYSNNINSSVYNIHFKNVFIEKSVIINQTKNTSIDTSFTLLRGFDNAHNIWVENYHASSKTLWTSGRWSSAQIIYSNNGKVKDILITGCDLYLAYCHIISGSSTVDNVYSQGTTITADASSGSPSQWAWAGSITRYDPVQLSNSFSDYSNITCRSSYYSRLVGRHTSSSSIKPIISNCYASDTFLKNGSKIVGDKNGLEGLSVSASLYQDRRFFDGTGIDDTVYLDWDFDNVWDWDETNLRPVLRMVHDEPTPPEPTSLVYVKTSDGWKINNKIKLFK